MGCQCQRIKLCNEIEERIDKVQEIIRNAKSKTDVKLIEASNLLDETCLLVNRLNN